MPLPYSLNSVNVYFIEGEVGHTVIDTGDTKSSMLTWKKILQKGINIEQIVLTHIHPDHCGLANWLQSKLNVPIIMSKQSYDEMIRRKDIIKIQQDINILLSKYTKLQTPKFEQKIPNPYGFVPNKIFQDGDMLTFGKSSFKAIWTPGHAYDQYCFYNENKEIMIVGDHIMIGISPMIELRGTDNENPLADYFQSLNRVKLYSTKLALSGHGNVIENIIEEIDKILTRHEYRLIQLIDYLKNGPKTVQEIFVNTYKNSDPKFYREQLISVIVRLIYLEFLGVIECTDIREGKLYFLINENKFASFKQA